MNDKDLDLDKDKRVSFVKNLYKGILNRNGDLRGIVSHANNLGINPSFDNAANLLSAFIGSREFSARHSAHEIIQYSGNIISIGSHCITSSVLKKNGLKRWSGPFDWIFSNIPMIAHCISDEFATFLDKSHHIKVDDKDRIFTQHRKCNHAFYKENYGINYVFNHHDMTEIDNYNYFSRCVDRFLNALRNDNNILINISQNFSRDGFDDICSVVDVYKNTTAFIFDVVHSTEDGFGVKLIEKNGRHELYKLDILGRLGPTHFTDTLDELFFCRIISSIIRKCS